MIASMTIFPYDPFPLEYGITLINFQERVEYSQLIFRLNKLKKHDTLSDDEDRILHLYTDPKDLLNEKLKDIAFVGDITTFDINSTSNLKYVFKKIISDSTIFKDRIESLNSSINDVVFDNTSEYNLPLDFESYSNFEKILKAKEVHLNVSKWENYCDKLMDVVSFYSEFTTKKLLLFHGLEKLLTLDQLNEMNDYLKSVSLTVISLESYPMTMKPNGLNISIYSIDEDHVRFDY